MAPHLKTTRLSVGTVFLVIFVLISSGPFGVEDIVSASGPGMALLLILVLPVVWGAPLALVCTELSSAIPDEGGAYVWAERGLGPFWAFQYGWWSTLSGVVDTALYAVLAATYVNGWLGLPPVGRWLLSVVLIAFFAALNVRSLRSMALSSVAFALIILAPCALMTVLGVASWHGNPFVPLTPPGETVAGSLGLGLSAGIWFYSGYESMSTMAGELEEPQRVIPRALLATLPFVVAIYLLPTAAGLASVGRWAEWGSDARVTLVTIARELGGPVLGVMMMVAALVSSLALYNAYLASCARTTLVMAQERLLPRAFALVHPRFGTPAGSILIAAGLHVLLAIASFESLLVIDVFLFVMSYLVVFVASVALRLKEPGLARPFRLPVGTVGLGALVSMPMVVALLLLVANGARVLGVGAAVAATGPVAYGMLRRRA
jgi:amino acid transporter